MLIIEIIRWTPWHKINVNNMVIMKFDIGNVFVVYSIVGSAAGIIIVIINAACFSLKVIVLHDAELWIKYK